jgi:ElaB/YqjD/DUF883 family membrane-anchored ribosome-binding protein
METTERIAPAVTEATLTRNIDQAAAGTHEAIHKVSEAARPAIGHITAGAHQAVDRIADVATHAAETLGVKGGQLKDVQARLLDDCSAYVRDHPLASLGIAAAAGFLLSRLTSSR